MQRLAVTVSHKAFVLANAVERVLGDDFHTHDLGLNAGEAAISSSETERLLKEWNSGEGA